MLELADRVDAPPAIRLGPGFLVFIIVPQLRFELRILARVKTLLFPVQGLVWILWNVDCRRPYLWIATISDSRSNFARAASILTRLLRMGREEEGVEGGLGECFREPAGDEERLCCWPGGKASTRVGVVGTLFWLGTWWGRTYSSSRLQVTHSLVLSSSSCRWRPASSSRHVQSVSPSREWSSSSSPPPSQSWRKSTRLQSRPHTSTSPSLCLNMRSMDIHNIIDLEKDLISNLKLNTISPCLSTKSV